MTTLPQIPAPYRSPRVQLPPTTPAVLRSSEGLQSRGELKVVSLTGGLLWLPKAADPGSRVKLMFVTQAGTVLAMAELLRPVSWVLQPFRFLSLEESDHRKLHATVQSLLVQQDDGYEWIDRYRAMLMHDSPPPKQFSGVIVAAMALATVGLGIAVYLCGAYIK
jgi:hypothetical protein